MTAEQIEAGRTAVIARNPSWEPTPQEAVTLAHELFRKHGRMSDRNECAQVGMLIGWCREKVWARHRMGELGLPTAFVERAQAFAAGHVFYFDPAGVERYVLDNERKGLPLERALMDNLRTKFDSVSKAFLASIWVPECPCCGVTFERGGNASPSFDHLIPGIRSRDNARLICQLCNVTKLDATPDQLHRIADWMTLTPAAMIERAQALPQIEGYRLNNWDGRRQLLSMKKYAARKAGVEFSLSLDDVVWSRSCPALGVEFDLPGVTQADKKGPKRNSLSFDRIDPRRGYVAGNVVLVSHQANSIMGNATSPDRIRRVADWFDWALAQGRRAA